MKKTILGLGLIMIMSIDIYVSTLNDAFENGKYEEAMRLGYQSHEVEHDTSDEYAVEVTLDFETAPYYGLQVGTTLFTS